MDDLTHPISPILGPELFFGLVGPAGSNLKLVAEILSSSLSRVGYSAEVIRLSKLISSVIKTELIEALEKP